MTNRISRRGFLATAPAVLGAASLLAAGGARPARAATPAYNILFVFTDQERFALPAPAGLSLPGRERLAESGVTFANHQVGAVMCSSSRAILMTGLQTPDNGIFENLNVPWVPNLSTKVPTIGHMLRRAGYYTAYKGKWHLNRDFDQLEPDRLLTDEMEAYGFADFNSIGDVVGHTLGGYEFDGLIADSAVTWLRRKGRPLNDQGKPWSLTVSLVNPHDIMYFSTDLPGEKPVQEAGQLIFRAAPNPEHSFYKPRWDVPIPASLEQPLDQPGRPGAHGEYQRGWDALLGHIPPEPDRWRRFNDFYVNSLRAVDRKLVQLLAELDDLDLTRRTIIVFTADHGEMAGAHGLRNKGPFAYSENIHVPFQVVHPDVAGGQTCKALSSHIDVAPTLLSMAGVAGGKVGELAGRALPGKDMTAVLAKPGAAGVNALRDSVLFTYSGLVLNDGSVLEKIAATIAAGENPKDPAVLAKRGIKPDLGKRGTMRTVFDGRYKFSRYFAPVERNHPDSLQELFANNDVELFDTQADPQEMTNIAAAEGVGAELTLAMSNKLEAAIKAEIGVDDGREMPDFKGIKWVIDTVD
ncbi:MAG: sulfatase-like hydrolase/transferase [Dongiaceae bacterium]